MAAPQARSGYYWGHGAPTDSVFEAAPGDGVLYVDVDNNRLYTHSHGSWLLSDVASATTLVVNRVVAAAAATVDVNTNACIVPWAGTVASVKYVVASTLTGADTNTRTTSLLNVGAAGSGTTSVATFAFVSATSATADVPKAMTLGAAGNLIVAAGDVLQWQSVHAGGSGLADPGGLVVISLSRT